MISEKQTYFGKVVTKLIFQSNCGCWQYIFPIFLGIGGGCAEKDFQFALNKSSTHFSHSGMKRSVAPKFHDPSMEECSKQFLPGLVSKPHKQAIANY